MTDTAQPEKFVPLAIVGLGCLFPKSEGAGAFWANIRDGVDCITEVPPTHWRPEDYFNADPKAPDMTYAQRGGFLSSVPFNTLEFGIAPRDIEATDTSQLLGLVAAKMALDDAGVKLGDPTKPANGQRITDRNRVSVILGVTGTLELVIPLGARLGHPKWRKAMQDAGIPEERIQDAVQRISDSYVPWQENSFPGLLGNVVAGRIANRLDLGGTNCVVDAACASSLSAVHLAALELQANRSDVVVTGGIDTFNDIFMFMCFSKTPALSKSGNSRPFDADGDGTILGEGLGVVVLKRLADAQRDNDTIYAILKSVGSSSDGKGNAIYAPSAAGQVKALNTAYGLAQVTPDSIELVEAHGTGTRVGDATEATSLTEVFGQHRGSKGSRWCAVGSVKSQIGHTKAAAGSASLIKAALALYYKTLPPTLKVTKPVEPLQAEDSPFYVNIQKRPWVPRAEHPRRAALSAFGFGGSNFHAVLEEADPIKHETDWDGTIEILPLGGIDATEVQQELKKVPVGSWKEFARYAEQARNRFSTSANARLVLVAQKNQTDLTKLVNSAAEKLGSSAESNRWQLDGAFFGSGPKSGSCAVLFPGQGSQYVGMLRDLACQFPELLESLAEGNEAVVPQPGEHGENLRLSDVIYPTPRFDSAEKEQAELLLRATEYAQPAIGAVSLGAWRLLHERFDFQPQAFAGHSYGELTALAAAARLTRKEFFTLSRLRGLLMARQAKQSDGLMLAAFAGREQLEELVAESPEVSFANFNAPNQTVVSGPKDAIIQFEQKLKAKQIRFSRLSVSAAFHSAHVAAAAEPFRESLESIPFPASSVMVSSNTTGGLYPEDASQVRELLGHQLAKPVEFIQQVRNLHSAGVRTFVEIGPGSVLTKLVERILAESPDFEAFALDSGSSKNSGVLNCAWCLARLVAAGQSLNLRAWESGSRCRPTPDPKPGATVPVCGANSVLARPTRPALPLLSKAAPVVNSEPLARTANRVGNAPMSTPSDDLKNAFALNQQTLAALQQLQQQTALLHKQFLESQEQAQRTLHQLVLQQQSLLIPGATVQPLIQVPLPTPVPVPTPAPLPVPVQLPVPVPASQSAAAKPSGLKGTERVSQEQLRRPVQNLNPSLLMEQTPREQKLNGKLDYVQSTLMAVIAEKTGYPVEMLNPSMTLDADLGIDSIKRVEILSTLQEKLPEAPIVKPEHLGTLHSLGDIAQFLTGGPTTTQMTDIALGLHSSTNTVPIGVNDFALLDFSHANQPSPSELIKVQFTLMSVIAEKTGYPVEMLTPEMTLDADLGIDSIKRVEILSTLQEKLPQAPVVKPEHLGTLHTLGDIAGFLANGNSTHPNTVKVDIQAATPRSQSKPTELPVEASVTTKLLPRSSNLSEMPDEQVSELLTNFEETTGRPPASAPTPTDRRAAAPGSWSFTPPPGSMSLPAEANRGVMPPINLDRVDRSILQAVDLEPAANRPRLAFPESAELWIVAAVNDPLVDEMISQLNALHFSPKRFPWSDPESVKPVGNPYGLILIAPLKTQNQPINRLGFRWLQSCGPKLRSAARQGHPAAFFTLTRFDGAFGLGDLSISADPFGGGLAGLVKTARYEWPELIYKALDVSLLFAQSNPTSAASSVVEELGIAGPIEVGIAPNQRSTLELARTVRRQATSQVPALSNKDVVLVTGGARGVTAEVAVALAEIYQPILVLTGRTPLPMGPEPEWLRPLEEEAAIKKGIAELLGSNATPKTISEQYARIIAQREITKTLSRIEQAGSKVAYFAVNVSNGRQVADLLHQIQVKFGPVNALVHGAGVIADRKIEDLSLEQFDSVYNTKVDGLKFMLELLANQDLKAMVLFSSTTGRFGRLGQLAYAVANEVLNKVAQLEARKRPNSRIVAINWGPWEGGMVTPGLRKLFESEGIGLIPLAEGGLFAVQELTAAGRAVEVIALGKPGSRGGKTGSSDMKLPISSAPTTNSPANTNPPATNPPPAELSLAYERSIDLDNHPVLRSHVLDGRAVLPMALHLELLAHAALHSNPGLVFQGLNDFRLTNGVLVEEATSINIRALVGKAVKQDKLFVVPVELRSKRRDNREVLHSKADVILTAALAKAPNADPIPPLQPYAHTVEEVYQNYLFHGPDMQGIEQIDGIAERAIVGGAYPAPSPSEWQTSPLRSSWVADPLALDVSFQLMILWTFAQNGTGNLPVFVGRYRQYRRSFPTGAIRVVCRITSDDGSFARSDMDFLDTDGLVIAQIQDYQCLMDRLLDQAFRRNTITPKAQA
jgi:acyl transferase domain-containing protein/NAD(P)-dependent dehydrogenase (short-subunit alcohol dehydrogenase family)